jgi:Ser/Thr protein kinase RdoA (MazF antagonist)
LEVLTVDQRSLLNNVAMVVRKRLAGFERTPQSWGLIHGDLMPENILADVSGIRVIDFDDCGFSWFVNDLATAVTMHLGSDQFDDLCSAWISGYRTVRPITDEELSFLPDLIMARLLQFLGWGHTRRFSATAIAMTKSVVEGACGFAEHLLAGGHAR